MHCLGKYLDTGENLEEEYRFVKGVCKYFIKPSLNNSKGMEFEIERQIIKYKRAVGIIHNKN